MPGAFICYRRSDSGRWASLLAQHLELRFGDDLVFRDFDDLKPGMIWPDEIHKAILASDVVLVLIGPHWFDADSRLRLENPDDVLRGEIVSAIEAKRTVMPILLGGASIPPRDTLPEPLRRLGDFQAQEMSEPQWKTDVEGLTDRLRFLIPNLEHLSLGQVQQEMSDRQQHYFQALGANPSAALKIAGDTLDRLNIFMPLFPQDQFLQMVRGYSKKNVAMALQDLGRRTEADSALDEAAQTFSTVLLERPQDPGALNGMGSVEAVRGDLPKAHEYVDQALLVLPDYGAALHDHAEILRVLQQQDEQAYERELAACKLARHRKAAV